MDADGHAELMGVARGELPLSWDLWSAFLDECDAITPTGRGVIFGACSTIAEFLGLRWIAKRRPDGGRPLMNVDWWGNRAPHVIRRILTLGCQIAVLRRHAGTGKVRKLVSGDTGHFTHWRIQLEVAGLALRAGWEVRLEPDTAGGRGDLLLTRESETMLVEVKWFEVDARLQRDIELTHRLSWATKMIEAEFRVSVECDLRPGMSEAEESDFIENLQAAATSAHRAGMAVELHPANGGRVKVLPGSDVGDGSFVMPVRQGDEFRRLGAAIEQKAAQARGDAPLWLRFDESRFFWRAHPDGEPAIRQHERIGHWLWERLQRFDHVAGIVLTNPAVAVAESESARILGGKGLSLLQLVNPPMGRESMIIPGRHPAAAAQFGEWASWYETEREWLAWALGQLRMPPLEEIVAC